MGGTGFFITMYLQNNVKSKEVLASLSSTSIAAPRAKGQVRGRSRNERADPLSTARARHEVSSLSPHALDPCARARCPITGLSLLPAARLLVLHRHVDLHNRNRVTAGHQTAGNSCFGLRRTGRLVPPRRGRTPLISGGRLQTRVRGLKGSRIPDRRQRDQMSNSDQLSYPFRTYFPASCLGRKEAQKTPKLGGSMVCSFLRQDAHALREKPLPAPRIWG